MGTKLREIMQGKWKDWFMLLYLSRYLSISLKMENDVVLVECTYESSLLLRLVEGTCIRDPYGKW